MRLHIIMHESFEAPAAIEKWATKRRHDITYTRLYQYEKYPSSVEEIDFLVVMGGPQSPSTTKEECPYFDAQAEIHFIKKVLHHNKLALGVCLGAQLIGEALGAKYDHSPNREIGVYKLRLTEDAKKDPIFSKFPLEFPVGHWHGDMPGLALDSKILAFSEGCPRQVVRYTPKAYGFQCHFEFTKDAIRGMIANCENELIQFKNLLYIQSKAELLKHDFTSMNKLLFTFLDYMEATYG